MLNRTPTDMGAHIVRETRKLLGPKPDRRQVGEGASQLDALVEGKGHQQHILSARLLMSELTSPFMCSLEATSRPPRSVY